MDVLFRHEPVWVISTPLQPEPAVLESSRDRPTKFRPEHSVSLSVMLQPVQSVGNSIALPELGSDIVKLAIAVLFKSTSTIQSVCGKPPVSNNAFIMFPEKLKYMSTKI